MSQDAVSRRELIVKAALPEFITRGYEGTSIGHLAGLLGISKAAIAYYFPTKDLFLNEFVGPFLDELDRAVAEGSTIRQVLDSYVSCIISHHEIAIWVDTDTTIQANPDFGGRLRLINNRIIDQLTNGSTDTGDRIRAMGVLGTLWRPARRVSTDDLTKYKDDMIDSALAGYQA